jgi:hypothetical protein
MPAGTGVWVVNTVPARALQTEKTGMPLIGVEHLGLHAGSLEGPHPAHAEQDLLADPVFGPAAVEAISDSPQIVIVGVDVGVEQVQLHPSDPGPPDLGLQQGAGDIDRDPHAGNQFQGHAVRVQNGIALLLPPVCVEVLTEIAQPVHEPYTGQRDAQTAGCLQMVAGQHAQATGVLGQGLRYAELGGKIGDAAQGTDGAVLKPPRRLQIAAQVVVHLAEKPHERGVGCQLLQALTADQAQEADRVVERQLPDLRVHPPEQVAGPMVPRPAQVERQFLQGAERFWQSSPDGEAAECPHCPKRYGTEPGSTNDHPCGAWPGRPVGTLEG